MNEMLKQFNLPNYIDGLSFADASKKIQSRFKDRVDKESIETQRELLERLRDMQEHVKQVQEQKEQSKVQEQRDPNALIAGENSQDESNISADESQDIEQDGDMMGQIQSSYGGYQPTNQQLFGTDNKFWSGGYEDTQNSYLNQMPQMPQQTDPNQSQTVPAQQTPTTQSISSLGATAGNMIGSSSGNTNGIGGLASGIMGGGSKGGSPGVGGYAQIAGTALELGNEAFGSTGVNTTGAVRVKPKKAGNAALSGAAKGATAGAVLGPWGAAAGAVVGAAAGYIGAKKQQKDAIIANRNATYADASKNDSQFAFGGGLGDGSLMPGIIGDSPKPADSNNVKNIVKYQPGVTNSDGKNGYYLYSKDPNSSGFNHLLDREFVDSDGMKNVQRTPQWQAYMRNKNKSNEYAEGGPMPKNTRPIPEELYPNLLNNYDINSELIMPMQRDMQIFPTQTKSGFEKYYNENTPTFTDKISNTGKKVLKAGEKGVDKIGNNLDLLRYAPVAGNIMQLANLKKPEQETTRELSNRYQKQLIDENSLVNLIREETNANREAILSSSGGSDASARANLLGSQLNSSKAISDAYLKAAEINANEGRQEQSFNLNVDQTNLGQSNLAQDIRARNEGNYQTQKSMLQSAVATDLGSIGQEELYKKFPEMLGMDYNWKGKYQKLKEEEDKKKK